MYVRRAFDDMARNSMGASACESYPIEPACFVPKEGSLYVGGYKWTQGFSSGTFGDPSPNKL